MFLGQVEIPATWDLFEAFAMLCEGKQILTGAFLDSRVAKIQLILTHGHMVSAAAVIP